MQDWEINEDAALRIAENVSAHDIQTEDIDLSVERSAELGNCMVLSTGTMRYLMNTPVPSAGNIYVSTSPVDGEGKLDNADYLVPGAGVDYPAKRYVIGNDAQPGKMARVKTSFRKKLSRVTALPVDATGSVIVASGASSTKVKDLYDRMRREASLGDGGQAINNFGKRVSFSNVKVTNVSAGITRDSVIVPFLPGAGAMPGITAGKFLQVPSLRVWCLTDGQDARVLTADLQVQVYTGTGGTDIEKHFYPVKSDFEFAGIADAGTSSEGDPAENTMYSCAIEPFEIEPYGPFRGNDFTGLYVRVKVDYTIWGSSASVGNKNVIGGIEADVLETDTSAFA